MMMKSDSLDGTEAMLQILDQCILKCYDSYSEAIESLLDDDIRESYKDVLEGAVLRILDCERLLTRFKLTRVDTYLKAGEGDYSRQRRA